METKEITPVFKPLLPTVKSVLPLLKQMDKNRTYSNFGPLSIRYREELSRYLAVDPECIVLTSSATLGLQGLITIMGLPRWNVPDYGFAAVGLAIRNSGATIRFRDVCPTSWMLTEEPSRPSDVGQIVVLPFGRKLGQSPLEFQDNTIIDAAASLGEVGHGFSWLRSSSAVCFSLHATKVLAAGEGGIVVCGSPKMANELAQWTNFGFQDRISHSLGTNAKLSEMACAYGLVSLREAERELEEWSVLRESVNRVCRESAISETVLNDTKLYGVNPYWLIKLKSQEQLNYVSRKLEDQGYETRKWWTAPLSSMPALSDQTNTNLNPVSKELSQTVLGLPFFRGLSKTTIRKIPEMIKGYVGYPS